MKYEYIIFTIMIQLFINLLFVNLFIIIKNKIKKSTLVNINSFDTNKYLYYRQILKNLSIAEIGYLYMGRKNIKKLILSTLENLELKHNIKWDNNINVINNNVLFDDERYLLEKYKFVGTKEFEDNFINIIEKSLMNKGYIKKLLSKSTLSFYVFIIITICMMLGDIYLLNRFGLTYFIFIISTILLLILLSFIFKEELSIKFYRTNEGNDLYLKIIALKNFMHSFSSFEEKQLEDIKLWNEYILYAIILDESKSIECNINNKYALVFNQK